MARRKTGAAVPAKNKNAGRRRVMVVNGRGKRRMMWQDEYEGRNA